MSQTIGGPIREHHGHIPDDYVPKGGVKAFKFVFTFNNWTDAGKLFQREMSKGNEF